MADHLVDRGVDGEGIAVLPLAAGDRLQRVEDVALGEGVDLRGGDAGDDEVIQRLQHPSGQAAGDDHALDLGGVLDRDLAHSTASTGGVAESSSSRASSIRRLTMSA